MTPYYQDAVSTLVIVALVLGLAGCGTTSRNPNTECSIFKAEQRDGHGWTTKWFPCWTAAAGSAAESEASWRH